MAREIASGELVVVLALLEPWTRKVEWTVTLERFIAVFNGG